MSKPRDAPSPFRVYDWVDTIWDDVNDSWLLNGMQDMQVYYAARQLGGAG